jgi:hypothetical protein
VVTTTTEIDPFNPFVSYEPVTQLNDINVTTKTITTGQHMPTYEQLLDDSLNRKNYFDTQNNNVYYGGCGRGGQTNGEFINYSVDDPFLASSGQMSNSEMPFEAWVNSANDNGIFDLQKRSNPFLDGANFLNQSLSVPILNFESIKSVTGLS